MIPKCRSTRASWKKLSWWVTIEMEKNIHSIAFTLFSLISWFNMCRVRYKYTVLKNVFLSNKSSMKRECNESAFKDWIETQRFIHYLPQLAAHCLPNHFSFFMFVVWTKCASSEFERFTLNAYSSFVVASDSFVYPNCSLHALHLILIFIRTQHITYTHFGHYF